MTLFVADVHPINLPLFWLLSFVVDVHALRVHRKCWRRLASRIMSMDVGRLVDSDEAPYFRSECVVDWTPLAEHLLRGEWHISYRGKLDYSVKAKQELAQSFQDLSLVRKFEAHHDRSHSILSAQHRYIERRLEQQRGPRPRRISFIIALNVLADTIWLHFTNLSIVFISGQRLVAGLATIRASKAGQSSVTCVYDAMNADESTLSSQHRYAFWPVDGEILRPEDIIFILPKTVSAAFRREVDSSMYRASTHGQLLSDLPFGIRVRAIAEFTVLLVVYPFRFWRGIGAAMRAKYLVSTQQWEPVMEWLQPQTYVSGVGSGGFENPALVAFRRRGIRTVMYCSSSNSYPFTQDWRGCDFRKVIWAHMLVSIVVVWSNDLKTWIESHPQDGVEVLTIGPLMPGDEGAMTASITQLRRDHRIGLNDGVPRRVVSVFDVAEQSRELRRTFGLYPSPYTAAYATAFLEDVVRLLDEFDDIIVVYKPKRDVGSSGYFFTTTLDQQVRTIAEHPRGVVLRSDVNPWVPVAVADLSISIPFTSGALIASHYRRRGLFHDPLGRAHEHRYHQIEQLITHSYRELTVAVRAALDGDAEAPAGIDRFIGSVPGDSSTAAFRQLIVNGSADHAPTSSIGHEAMTAR